MRAARRFLGLLFRIEAAVAMLAFLAISLLLIADVASRELAGSSIWGAQRISVYLMIVTGFLGLGLAADRGRHLRPRFADGLVPAPLAPAAGRAGSAIMFAVFAWFAWLGVEFVMTAYEYGDLAQTIKVPLWTVQLIVPYAFASLALRYLVFAVWPELRPAEADE